MQAVEAAEAISPLLRQGESAAANRLVACAPCELGRDLEARRVDETVELVLATVRDDTRLRDALDAAALGVDERDVGPIEGRQILVVEAGALAELAVVGLEGLGGHRVLDDLRDASAHGLHRLEVHALGDLPLLVERERRLPRLHDLLVNALRDLRPAIAHEVLLLVAARREDLEILDPSLLPAGLEVTHPVGVGRAVVAHADPGRGALEDVEMLGARAEMGDDLDGGGAGPDDADALVVQAREMAVRVAAREVVVPARRVE